MMETVFAPYAPYSMILEKSLDSAVTSGYILLLEVRRMRISELAEAAGVSVRTLRWYDKIGLLLPEQVDPQSGYRNYGPASLERLRDILFYRELDFPLEEIRRILDAPDYDRGMALARQKQLLTLKKQRIDRLLKALDAAEKGEPVMTPIDNTDYIPARDAFAAEAKARWGQTDAYRAFVEQTKAYTAREWSDAQGEQNTLMEAFGAAAKANAAADDSHVQTLVAAWQACITKHFYPCTDAILRSLGQMYLADERFTANLDAHGAGTAKLMSEAIARFVNAKQR